jgi:hypothetical protein
MFADRQVSGTLGALSASLTINTQGTSTLILDVSGTWVGTIQVQVSFDNGATYPGTISAFTPNTFYPGAGGLTANGIYYVATGGITSVKLVMTAYTSGSASVEMNAGAGSQYAKLLSFTTDGTNVAAVKAASTAAVAADPALVTAFSPNSPLPSGGNTIGAVTIPGLALPFNIVGNAAQGAATSGAPVLVAGSDGTNVQTLRVKPASTAAVATDPALVVAVSPNNSVSTTTADVTGTGALGALNASVQVNTAGLLTAGFQLAAGTLIGTIVPEVSFDGGTTWNPTNFYNIALGAVASIVFGSANTATAASIVGLGGAGLSRVRVSAYTSGTANVTVRATTRDESDIALLQAISTNTGASATDFTQTGTITATNGTVVVNGQGVYTVSASITGTWAGTLVAEGQLADNSWVQVPMYLVNTTLPYLAQFTTTVNGTFLITGGGYLNIRIRASVYTSGTVAVALDGSLAQQTNFAAQLGAWNLTDRTATGNLAALNATAVVNTGGCSTVGFDVTGTWVGTIIFEAQTGDSTWWAQDAWVQSGTSTSGGISSNGQGVIPCGGFSQVRLRMTPYTSGTAVISLNAGAGSNVQQATIVGSPLVLVGGETPVGSAPFGNPVLVGGINSAGNTESLGVTVDRAAMTGGVQTGVPIIGASSGVGRLISLDRFGHVTPGYQTLMAVDPIEGSTVNSWLWAQSTATMTIAQTTGLLVLNNSNTTTTTTYAILTSNRQFPITNQASIAMSYRALVTQTTNAVQEIGFGAPTTTTAIINNGAFFRIKTSGQIFLVTSYNGTETVSAQVATLVNTSYYLFLVELSDNGARFIMEDANGVPLVDQSVTLTLSTPDKAAVSHLPAFARVYTTGAAGAAPKITISSFQAWQFSINSNKPWQQQLAASGRVSVINPTTFAQTTSSMTAAPATETPSNTAGGYNNLGGDYAVALTTASENPLSVFGFQVPSPYTFYLTSLIFSVPFIMTTIGVTGVPVIEWLAVANCSSANINTGGGQKFPLGLNFLYTSATQAAGTFCTTQGNLTWNPDVPIVCLPGTFLHLAYKVFITSAAATPGVTRGSVYVDGYFE